MDLKLLENAFILMDQSGTLFSGEISVIRKIFDFAEVSYGAWNKH